MFIHMNPNHYTEIYKVSHIDNKGTYNQNSTKLQSISKLEIHQQRSSRWTLESKKIMLQQISTHHQNHCLYWDPHHQHHSLRIKIILKKLKRSNRDFV